LSVLVYTQDLVGGLIELQSCSLFLKFVKIF